MNNDPLFRLKYKTRRGSLHARAKLTEEQVLEIRRITALKARAQAEARQLRARANAISKALKEVTQEEMAKHYGVHRATIQNVVDEFSWTHI